MPVFRADNAFISNTLEASFVQRAIKHDREAFAILHDCHLDRVYSFISFALKNTAETEDLTQEVFIKAWKSIHKYRITGAPFVTWLTAIARNLVADHFRAKKKEKYVPLEEERLVDDDGNNPEALVEAKFEQEQLRNLVSSLKGEKQQVIVLRFIVGMGYREIAGLLKKREGAVRVIQFRALKELKARLEAEG